MRLKRIRDAVAVPVASKLFTPVVIERPPEWKFWQPPFVRDMSWLIDGMSIEDQKTMAVMQEQIMLERLPDRRISRAARLLDHVVTAVEWAAEPARSGSRQIPGLGLEKTLLSLVVVIGAAHLVV